jgi:predicted ATPase
VFCDARKRCKARAVEQEFSDGTLRLVGMLWAVLERDAPLLLEEPELSLHEAVVKQLPRLIARAAEKNGRQIIVTTHAEEMLNDRSVDPSEVLYLVTTGEETQVHLASEDEAIHAAVAAKVSLGRLVNGRTRPAGIEQMSLAFPESSSR